MKLRLALLLTAALALTLTACGPRREFITIGTGGLTGVYYHVGRTMAGIINRDAGGGIRANADSTGGSVYNINAVMSGDLEFGMAQSDRQFQAWHGLAEWEGNPQDALRSVISLHPEIVTLVAAEDAGIVSLGDVRGRRVNIGNPGSGHRQNAIDVLTAAGVDWEADLQGESLKPAEAPKMVQDGRIDAFFYTVGHPNGAINEATSGRRKVRFVPLTGIDSLLEKFPYYARAVIPAGLYPMAASREDVESLGVMTTLVSSEGVPEHVVYTVVKAVCGDLQALKDSHPALAQMDTRSMLTGHTAPPHPGALRYFREAGLVDDAP